MSMKQTLALLILAFLSVHIFAMVPRHRVARDTEKEICSNQTPCSWGIYNPTTKEVYMTVENTYCTCEDDKHCTLADDDVSSKTLVYKCMAATT